MCTIRFFFRKHSLICLEVVEIKLRCSEAHVRDAEEQFLCDAQQTAAYGHNQQNQATEYMDGEV